MTTNRHSALATTNNAITMCIVAYRERKNKMGNTLSNFTNYERGNKQIYEFSVCWNGFKFQIIYGEMFNGDYEQWFIAIPEEGVTCIAAEPTNIYTNEAHLEKIFGYRKKAQAIALAIMMHYEEMKGDK